MTDETDYHRWLDVKASAMSRPTLACGCRNNGQPTYLRGTCDHIVCGVHADGHECGPSAGPTRVSWVPEIADLEHPTTAELMGGVRLDGFLAPATRGWVQLDDSDHPDWAWRGMIVPERPADDSATTVTSGLPYGLRPGDLVVWMGGRSSGECRVAEPPAKPPAGTSWLKTCETPPKRSWFSRLWRWMWLRG